jgi:hypothetical protein
MSGVLEKVLLTNYLQKYSNVIALEQKRRSK